MLSMTTTAKQILQDILGRWKMESHATDVVLVSIVRDEVTVVEKELPLLVKKKWPLIVSSDKSQLPKCRFTVRCKTGASLHLQKLLGAPLPTGGLRKI